MGSTFIEHTLDGTLTQPQLQAKFSQMVAEDRHYNGADPYGGGWSTTRHGLQIHNGVAFSDLDTARQHVMDHTEKWGPALAVRYHAVKKVLKREPTFRGEKRMSFGQPDHSGWLWKPDYEAGRTVFIPADQLTDAQKSAVVTAATALAASARTLALDRRDLDASLEVLRKLGKVPAATVARQQGEVRKSQAAYDRARARVKTLEARLVPKVHQQVVVPQGERWLIGAWAAI